MPVFHRHRIVVGLIPHQRLGTGSGGPLFASFIRCRRQREQFLPVPLEALSDGFFMPPQLSLPPLAALFQQVRVQLLPTGHPRYGDHEVPSRVAHQSLHVSLVITFSRPAELYREQAMRLQFAKCLGRFALPAAQDSPSPRFWCCRTGWSVAPPRKRRMLDCGPPGTIRCSPPETPSRNSRPIAADPCTGNAPSARLRQSPPGPRRSPPGHRLADAPAARTPPCAVSGLPARNPSPRCSRRRNGAPP